MGRDRSVLGGGEEKRDGEEVMMGEGAGRGLHIVRDTTQNAHIHINDHWEHGVRSG